MFIFKILSLLLLSVSAKDVKLTKEEFEARAVAADKEIFFVTPDTIKDFLDGEYRFIFYGVRWCKFCKRLGPRWLALQEGIPKSPDFKDKDFKIAKFDCTDHEEFCTEQGVMGYPSLYFYEDGELAGEYEDEQKTKPMAIWLNNVLLKLEQEKKEAETDAKDEL